MPVRSRLMKYLRYCSSTGISRSVPRLSLKSYSTSTLSDSKSRSERLTPKATPKSPLPKTSL